MGKTAVENLSSEEVKSVEELNEGNLDDIESEIEDVIADSKKKKSKK